MMENCADSSKHCAGDSANIEILFELVGATQLVLRDDDDLVRGIDPNSLQPFCVVKFDGKRIHKTKPSEDLGCNPIWTPHASKSIFLLQTSARELSRSVMNISLYTKKESSLPSVLTTVTSVFLGQVNIESNTILSHCDEERFELNIEDELGEHTSDLGQLALRCRVATQSDIEILSNLNEKRSSSYIPIVGDSFLDSQPPRESDTKLFHNRTSRPLATLVTEKDESELAQTTFVQSVGNIFTAQTSTCAETGQTKVRVKPYPNPDRVIETEFLRPHDLNVEARSPSSKWVEAGSGTIGKLNVEILSCHDLPNLDTGGEMMGNFTDSFCTLVYEDTCAMTDVIDDELSPRWMPWTNRAFSFNIIHPASILYIGVFDFDVLGSHDPIGRVAVNVCNLQRDTIHTLKYDLYRTANVTQREAAGSITIRVKLEWFDPRAALLEAWKPRPKMHVNVTKEKTFQVIQYTCYGEYGKLQQFDATLMRSYVNELLEYKWILSYVISDTIWSLILWRGQVEFCSVMLPVHSFILFSLSTRLVEKPQLIVPYSLLGVAWIMLANLTIRRQHPSPWQRRLSFIDYLNILRTGKSSVPVKCIREYEGAEEAEAYELAWKKRVENDLIIAEKRAQLLQKINNISTVNIHTEESNGSFIPLDLLNRLARYQGILGRMCKKFRLAKIILTWEESIVSFFVTATFLSAGLVALLLPWGFILTWVGRILVWGFLGPHMKLVDLVLRANDKKDGGLKNIVKNFDIKSHLARLSREEAMKVKDMKGVAFGTYGVEVPSFNLTRHLDRPLPQSSSRVCRKSPPKLVQNDLRVSVTNVGEKSPFIPGQQLYGPMIPRPEGEYEIHQRQKVAADVRMEAFRKCIRRIYELDGLSDFERRQLRRMDSRVSMPMAIGYEVVPFEFDVAESVSIDTESTDDSKIEPTIPNAQAFSQRSVSVRLTSDKLGFVDERETKDMVLRSDGKVTYCISDGCIEDEEGLEVIGTGRFQSSSYQNNDDDDDDFNYLVANESIPDDRMISSIDTHDPNLEDERFSLFPQSTSSVQVVYYEPPECGKFKAD